MGFYLRHSIGFFLQLAPCAQLCLIPFAELAFRFPKRLVMIGYAMFGAAVAALFPVILFPPVNTGRLPLAMLANLYMLLMLLICVAVFFWVVRDTIEKSCSSYFWYCSTR